MIPLKRLLNNDDDADDRPHHESPHRRSSYDVNAYSETPVLAGQSWTDLLGELLYPDNHGDDHSNSNDTGVDSTWLRYAQEGIELWAAQDLPSPSDAASQSEPTTIMASESTVNGNVEQVCYGMIYRASVQLAGNMLQADRKLEIGNESQTPVHYMFKIRKLETQLHLVFPDGSQFGLLNTHTSQALEGLVEHPSVQFEALAHIATLRETIGRAAKASDAIVRVNINVYGSPDDGKSVGRHLSIKKVYLQRPDQLRPGSVYDNPHFLRIQGIQESSICHKLEEIDVSVSRSGIDDIERFQKTVSDVYASLKRGSGLNRLKGDGRLKTHLLPHQEEALDFMTQRETGRIPPEFCLWKPIESEGQVWYCHEITKARSRIQHPEAGGGVLADEMGMGKSLSILSLIVKTLEDAHSWASASSANSSSAIKRPSRATLVVVSSALLIDNWLKEIETHLDGTLKTIKYYGKKRETQIAIVQKSDIVLTTYHTLTADIAAKSGRLNEVSWFRVVLDEAHMIRRQATTLYRAASELSANSRWCITGTPIQNRLEDIGALFAFIRARPFDSIAMFRRFIAAPFEESEERRAIASQRLSLLLDSLCLRRTKDLLDLPKQQYRTRILEFSKEELDQYEGTKKIMIRAIRQRAGELDGKGAFGMFQAQLQLRILCNHGTFQHPFSWARRSLLNEREDALCSMGQNGEINCSSCRQRMPILDSNNVHRTYVDKCAHVLCSECWSESAEHSGWEENTAPRCPLCFPTGVPTSADEVKFSYPSEGGLYDDYFRLQGHSSKVTALMSDVREGLIIFSCWTRTLNLIARYLSQKVIPFARIDGACPLTRRQKILDDFARNQTMPVLIMTMDTGAFGQFSFHTRPVNDLTRWRSLNLTSANRVFIVEPQWNPSVESQAIARALRIGQGQTVVVTRYVMNRTIEQEMRSQQDRKLKIAEVLGSEDLVRCK